MDRFSELTERLDEYVEMGLPFYDCAVNKEGECVYRHFGGYIDPLKTKKPTGTELYNLYSCSKLITCVAALQLYEQGKFDLNDYLSDYMSEFKEMTVRHGDIITKADKRIRIVDLFTMTAGFSYQQDSPAVLKCKAETKGKSPTRIFMKYLAKEPLLFEPGEKWEYSLCHDVLAALVEVISGTQFSKYVKDNIFTPLHMYDSDFRKSGYDYSKLVNQYRYYEGKGAIEIDKACGFDFGEEFESGGAGCVSTVNDYMKFLEALRVGDIILKKETIKLLATDRLTKEQTKYYFKNQLYGFSLGQRCPKDENRSDFGWDGAAGAYYAVDQKNGITVYLGTHILGFDAFLRKREEILQIIQGILK